MAGTHKPTQMEATLEVRWFGPGPSPGGLAAWFDDLGAPGPQRRTDTYLLLPGTDDLGVKLREGGEAFEIKLRQQDLGDAKLAGVSGRLERWEKWSFPVRDDVCREAALGLPPASLVDVEKDRRMMSYRLAGDGSAIRAHEGEGDGCSVELTALTVQGSDWWSVGFEAFGSEARLHDALRATEEAVFALATAGSAVLAAALSCGYPAWLHTVASS